jgi:uncharacterized protein YndB with AHSA1/START domain
MHTIDRTIRTAAPPQQVWDYLADFTTTEQWDPPTRSTVRQEGDGGVGTRYHNVSRVLGRDVDIDYTVVEHSPPRRLQLRGTTPAMEMLDTITIEPDGDGTTVRYVAEFHPQGGAKLAAPLLPAALERLGDDAARQMAQCLERL